jgi:hypothetical protein
MPLFNGLLSQVIHNWWSECFDIEIWLLRLKPKLLIIDMIATLATIMGAFHKK